MASIRESESREIFAAADRNGDGSLTFSEWLEWLGEGDDSFKLGYIDTGSTGFQAAAADGGNLLDAAMIASLGQVLSHAVAALKVFSMFI
jgi:hypothetical protein